MRRVLISETTWQEQAFWNLCGRLHISRLECTGLLVMLWSITRANGFVSGSADSLASIFPEAGRADVVEALCLEGYIRVGAKGELHVRGNAEALKLSGAVGDDTPIDATPMPVAVASEMAAPSRKSVVRRASKSTGKTPLQKACVLAYDTYRAAYVARYGNEPLRNAKVNGQVKMFVERVGMEFAPAILTFYVAHPDSGYRKNCHPISMALKDAESLYTQWRGNRPTTAQSVRDDYEALAQDIAEGRV